MHISDTQNTLRTKPFLICVFLALASAHGFANVRVCTTSASTPRGDMFAPTSASRCRQSTALRVFDIASECGLEAIESAASTLSTSILATSPSPTTSSSSTEAQVLTNCAHVLLDFSGFLGNPSKTALRLLAIIGRLMVLSADYVPDHFIRVDELAIQLVLLAIALQEFWTTSSNTPAVSKEDQSITERERVLAQMQSQSQPHRPPQSSLSPLTFSFRFGKNQTA